MTEVCKKCGGAGMRVLSRSNGERYAEECDCLQAKRTERLMKLAGIPKRYEDCLIETYDNYSGADPSLARARLLAEQFVENYPFGTGEKGLLFVGTVGVGKTHLSIAILRELIMAKGVRGLFCDYRELLRKIQNSYNPQIAATELQILQPVFDAEVLVIDELGALKPTDWVWDTVALILNTRYNNKRTTIFTSNYADKPAAHLSRSDPDTPPPVRKLSIAQQAMQDESLGDRIGERMWSRLAQMCVTINMSGEDYRQLGRSCFVKAGTNTLHLRRNRPSRPAGTSAASTSAADMIERLFPKVD